VQFLLEEEIFPHTRLGRGLPYAISRTVHYLIVLVGFLAAMAILGIDMTKFTILVSAFTVGVGFGLQNIVNNFVSGLILLFERPVKVGDVVEIGTTTGLVEHIGIRASVVRTATGSEVIVPNSKLIQDPLTNWTYRQGQRAIELQVAVNVGSDPQKVIAAIKRVAEGHADVLKYPPPRVLTTRLGPDWMGFTLNAYTGKVLEWVQVSSDLAAAIPPALTAEGVAMR
jgi:small-conductance mechanosensitive channel